MIISAAMQQLLSVLDEKESAIYQRVHAMTRGEVRQARYIEQFVYPGINKRIRERIEWVNQAFRSYENGKNEKAKAA